MTTGLEILTVEEMAAADAAAIAAGTPGIELMERAGQAVADAICERWTPRPTAVLCGPGNNGGDGYVVVRILKRYGWTVWVERLAPPTAPDAIAAAGRWDGRTIDLQASDGEAALVVDALFGAGLTRPLEGVAKVRARHVAHAHTVAIDTPSGIHGDTGKPVGDAAFTAALTVTFHRRKPAHVLYPGKTACGEVVVADIGLGDTPASLHVNAPRLWRKVFPWPSAHSHKHARGRLAVVSCGPWNTGAARLAARGGLRIGAGLVTVLSLPDALAVNAAHLEAIMLAGFDSDADLTRLADAADAVVIGPAGRGGALHHRPGAGPGAHRLRPGGRC